MHNQIQSFQYHYHIIVLFKAEYATVVGRRALYRVRSFYVVFLSRKCIEVWHRRETRISRDKWPEQYKLGIFTTDANSGMVYIASYRFLKYLCSPSSEFGRTCMAF